VLEGLAAAHSLGVIHRDVKPGNIFLVEGASAAPRVKILDLGLAKNLDASEMLTRSGLVMGTPDYLAPELLSCDQKHAWSPAADVFAVGVVAYVLLTGRRPLEGFVAPDSSALGFVKRSAFYREHAYDARWAPDVSGRVPAAIADVVFRALAIGRERRYADAGEMLRAFDEACARGGFGVEGDGLVVRSDAMEAASAATVPARDWSAPGADAQRLEAELRAPAAASTIVLHPPPPLLRQAAPHRLGPVPGPALSPFAEAPPSEPPTDHRRTAWLAAGLLLLLLLLLAVGLIAIASWLFG
jgi:serine/threonine-protein kinase